MRHNTQAHADKRSAPGWIGEHQEAAAYTLVELLVMIAIVVTLLALLLPSLARAREAARRAHCANNLRQLASAVILSTHDTDGFLPGFYAVSSQGIGGGQGAGQYKVEVELDLRALSTISNNPSLLICLSDPSPALVDVANATNQLRCSYAYNFFLSFYHLRWEHLPTAKIAVFYDGLSGGNGNLGGGWWLDNPESNRGHNANAISVRTAERRHSDRLNVSFLDGHCEWLADIPADAVY